MRLDPTSEIFQMQSSPGKIARRLGLSLRGLLIYFNGILHGKCRRCLETAMKSSESQK